MSAPLDPYMQDIAQHSIFAKWRLFDNLTTFFAITGLIIAIVSYEIDVFNR